uniref:Uncharacterized protein n=1 Tax=Rhizophora mucronata TaxID=61149 RepID=A0A2P2PLV7_RHIMU
MMKIRSKFSSCTTSESMSCVSFRVFHPFELEAD